MCPCRGRRGHSKSQRSIPFTERTEAASWQEQLDENGKVSHPGDEFSSTCYRARAHASSCGHFILPLPPCIISENVPLRPGRNDTCWSCEVGRSATVHTPRRRRTTRYLLSQVDKFCSALRYHQCQRRWRIHRNAQGVGAKVAIRPIRGAYRTYEPRPSITRSIFQAHDEKLQTKSGASSVISAFSAPLEREWRMNVSAITTMKPSLEEIMN